MEVRYNKEGSVEIMLSRRNILSLLAKLDGYPKESFCSLFRTNGEWRLTVAAQEDDAHYRDRQPGLVHPVTEANL